jgi:hypothetical protein
LPSLEYFCALLQFDEIQLDKHEHYVKQSYRNRCFINTAQGPVMLVVPLTNKHGKVPIKDVSIDYSIQWQNNHWRTIESAYRKAPYYEYYSEDIRKIIYHSYKFIFDLNLELLSFCLKCLRHKAQLSVSVSYQKKTEESVSDLRSVIQSKIPHSARPIYKPIRYTQVFGNQFVPNLSVIDLLLCEGPRAGSLILASQHQGLNK